MPRVLNEKMVFENDDISEKSLENVFFMKSYDSTILILGDF